MDLLVLRCPKCKKLVRYYDKNPKQEKIIQDKYKCTKCDNYIIKCRDTIYNIIVNNSMSSDNAKMTKIMSSIPLSIADGTYKGTIESEEIRHSEYNGKTITYNDFTVKFDDLKRSDGETVYLKAGFSFVLSSKSELGQLYERLTGEPIDDTKETEYDTSKLVGKKITFLVMNETKEKGTFAVIVKKSIKLAK